MKNPMKPSFSNGLPTTYDFPAPSPAELQWHRPGRPVTAASWHRCRRSPRTTSTTSPRRGAWRIGGRAHPRTSEVTPTKVGKPLENHWKAIGKWCFNGILWDFMVIQ